MGRWSGTWHPFSAVARQPIAVDGDDGLVGEDALPLSLLAVPPIDLPEALGAVLEDGASKFFVSAITFSADQQLPYFPCFFAGRDGEWESGIVVTEVKNSPTSDWTPDASQVTRLGHCDCAPRTRCRPSRHPIKSPPRPHRDVRNAREVSFQGDLQGNGEGVLL